MEQPPGFQQQSATSSLVCKLHKAIYGLKQPLGTWFDRLHEFLTSVGFISSKANSSLVLRFTEHTPIFILVYVDDILITGESTNDIQLLVQILNDTFS